jgi:hypothetical protein
MCDFIQLMQLGTIQAHPRLVAYSCVSLAAAVAADQVAKAWLGLTVLAVAVQPLALLLSFGL